MMSDHTRERSMVEHPSRRSFLGMSSVALATVAFAGPTADAQTKASTQKAEHDHSSSDPGQENKVLLGENPNSNDPPPTDHGDIVPIWYSFDLVKKRVKRVAGRTKLHNVSCHLQKTSQASTCVLPPAAIANYIGTRLMNGPMYFTGERASR